MRKDKLIGLGACVAVGWFAGCSSAGGGSGINGAGANAGTGSNGGGIGIGGSGGGIGGGIGVDGGGTGGLPQGCASEKFDGELVPVDLHVMMDKSGSMKGSKWSSVTTAIGDFVNLPNLNKLGMGIDFFPQGSSGSSSYCSPSTYSSPVVPIAPLPGVGPHINSAMQGINPSSGTPMAPALKGAISYAQGWASSNPTHTTAVVLATDGQPTGCSGSNSVNDVANAAAQGVAATPSVKTFVIGVGSSLTNLNAIAQNRGGTNKAIIISASNAAKEFLQALDKIRGSLSCQYTIPQPKQGKPDYEKLNVGYTPQGGQQEIFPKVKSAADCQGKKAWHYDDPSNPKYIVLCPAACDVLGKGKGSIDIVIGCKSIVE